MFIIKKLWCRGVQTAFRAALPFLPYREPKLIPSCDALGCFLKNERGRSVLIVTDKGILANGLIAPIEEALKRNNIRYSIYGDTLPNPTVSNVEEALRIYREDSCDTLIAVGGGSAMDCAKALGARVVYPKKQLDQMKGVMRVRRRLPDLIAIPTTAGTGSETTLAAVITDTENHTKFALMSFPLIPHYAVLDAELTCSLPPHLTASTGIDALTHAVEAYIGRATTRETRRLALKATEMIFSNLETACRNGNDINARKSMLYAAYSAGVAFSKSYVGYVHAIAHSLGGRYGTPHGLANAVVMPYVLDAYGKSAYKKLHRLGVAAGVCSKEEGHRAGAERFISEIKALNSRIGIPETLTDIRKEDVAVMAKIAEREANPLYPVPRLMTKRELEKLYFKIGRLDQE